MKKTQFLIVLVIVLSHNTFGQAKEMYLNDDLIEISKAEFEKTSEDHIYNLRYELDTSIVNVKVKSIKKGKITGAELDMIRSALSSSSNQDIPKENILVINYFHEIDECISSGNKPYRREKYSKYLKELKKHDRVSQFFMYKTSEVKNGLGLKLKWIEDRSGIIEKMFLPLHYPCGGYVLIDENGNFFVRKGEHDILHIPYYLRNKETTFSHQEN